MASIVCTHTFKYHSSKIVQLSLYKILFRCMNYIFVYEISKAPHKLLNSPSNLAFQPIKKAFQCQQEPKRCSAWGRMWEYTGVYVRVRSRHCNDVIMGAIASQITSLTIVYSVVYSNADQRKHQSSTSLPLCGEFTGDRWIPRTNGQLRGKCFHLMTSSWCLYFYARHN